MELQRHGKGLRCRAIRRSAASSYVRGDRGKLMDTTIGEALAKAAATWPDRLAIISAHQGVRWSWSELQHRVECLARGLRALGLAPGERIAIRAPNCAEWTLVQLAAASCGLVLVSLHAGCRSSELLYALQKVEVAAIIGLQRRDVGDFVSMMESIAPEIATSTSRALFAADVPELRHVIKLGGSRRRGWLEFEDLVAGGTSQEPPARPVRSEEPVSIQFTSGTTGRSKAATLSHRGQLNNAMFLAEGLRLTADDRLCIPVPLHHCFGMVMGNLACLLTGAAMVYPSSSFDPQAVLRTIAAERCTAVYGVPTMFISELEHLGRGRWDLTSLRTGVVAGAPCPPSLFRRVVQEMGIPELAIAYGMTETSPVSFLTPLDDPLDVRAETVGAVMPTIEAKLVGQEGATVPRGEVGELYVRGYSVMLGYWNDEVATAGSIDIDGWIHTADLGILDDNDRLRIAGRASDMVIRGGENIYPREIEDLILQCPGVAQVSVIGVPDPVYGQEICAWIKPLPAQTVRPEDVASFCRQKVANFKAPRYILIVDDLPLTPSGKVKTFELQDAFGREYQGLPAAPDRRL